MKGLLPADTNEVSGNRPCRQRDAVADLRGLQYPSAQMLTRTNMWKESVLWRINPRARTAGRLKNMN